MKNVLALLTAGISQYVGAALAVGLFATASDLSVAWGRIFAAAVILLAWRRPWRYPNKKEAALFGTVLAAMNILFYIAIDRIALGTAVSLEFLGPVLLAATAMTFRTWVGSIFAVLGVFLISWVGLDLSDPVVAEGLFFSLAAGGTWALYMTLGKKVATSGRGIDGLAIGLGVGAAVFAPFGAPLLNQSDPTFWLMIFAVGLLSSVIPYGLDQFVLTSVPATTFAILNSILPATSLLVGAIILAQRPSGGEIAGLAAISIAVLVVSYRPGRIQP